MRYLIALFVLFATPVMAATVREQTTIDRDQVVVGDLFDDVGEAAAQPVGTAPAPGAKNTYDVSALNRVAKAYNLNWQPNRLDVKAIVSRAATKVSTAQIQDAVRTTLADQIKTGTTTKYDVQLDRRQLELNLPASQTVANVKLVDFNYDPKSYRFSSSLIVELNGTDTAPVTALTGRAVPQYEVPVVLHRIEPGVVIAESDLSYITVAADKITPDLIRDINQMAGRETRRPLMEGSTISANDLRPALLVKRGNMVTMVVETGSLRITARGRALADAAKGQTVRVMNLQSNKTVEGTVSDNGDVLIGSNS